jgi:hypothetical protein
MLSVLPSDFALHWFFYQSIISYFLLVFRRFIICVLRKLMIHHIFMAVLRHILSTTTMSHLLKWWSSFVRVWVHGYHLTQEISQSYTAWYNCLVRFSKKVSSFRSLIVLMILGSSNSSCITAYKLNIRVHLRWSINAT